MTNSPFLGERLRLARHLSGLSLEAVGERVGASRQHVHQLEVGKSEPSKQMAAALADALFVDASFFATPIPNLIQLEHCHFRRLKSASQNLIMQANARANALGELLDEMEKYVSLPKVDIPEFPDAWRDNKGIEEAAENTRLVWRLRLDAPINNMTRVLENAGVVIVTFDDLSDKIDALSITRKRPVIVRSSAKASAPRMRFDLAHELAHLVMHEGVITGDSETERQAHRFASAFLIPAEAFIREFPRTNSRRLDWHGLRKMKIRWGVSLRAIIRRAYDLGIIDAAQYRIGNIHLSKNGQIKSEWDDDIIATENIELLNAALEYINNNNFSALIKLRNRLGLTNSIFFRLTGYNIPEDSRNVIPL